MKIKDYKFENIKVSIMKNLPFNRSISLKQSDKLLSSMANFWYT